MGSKCYISQALFPSLATADGQHSVVDMIAERKEVPFVLPDAFAHLLRTPG